jgi:hypothetical protein
VATYPSQIKTFVNKSNVVDLIDASHPNLLQDEVSAIQTVIGTTPARSTTPSSSGTFIATQTDFDNVKLRLANIETGIVADTHSQYIKKTSDGSNVVIPTNSTTKGVTIRGVQGQTANLQEWQQTVAVTNVVAAQGGVTFTANNNFVIGQKVTTTGITPGSYNLTDQTITDCTSTNFVITSGATGTFVSGGSATSTVSYVDNTATLVGYAKTGVFTAKGDLAVASGPLVLSKLSVGANGTYLVADSTAPNGIKWLDIDPVTETGAATLTNKVLTSPQINIGINPITGTAYTVGLSDNGKLTTLDNAAAIGVTIPLNATTAFPIGAQLHFAQINDGTVTFVPATNAVIIGATPGYRLRVKWSTATITKIATNTWILVGDLKI